MLSKSDPLWKHDLRIEFGKSRPGLPAAGARSMTGWPARRTGSPVPGASEDPFVPLQLCSRRSRRTLPLSWGVGKVEPG